MNVLMLQVPGLGTYILRIAHPDKAVQYRGGRGGGRARGRMHIEVEEEEEEPEDVASQW